MGSQIAYGATAAASTAEESAAASEFESSEFMRRLLHRS